MVKVSVVIPVYNVEDYLGECLDSVVNQTLSDIEVICVNDGSTDRSLEILNEYAARDSRITVIDQENGGHAVATNRGMKLAKGEYLYLMDSDDMVDVHALEETVKIADERKVDFVIFQAINYYMDTDEYKEQENYSMNELADFVGDSVFNWKDIRDYVFSITVTPWSKIYRRDFIEKNNCQFSEGLVFDDNIFFWEVLFSAERITFYRKHLFTRRWHSASSTMSGNRNFFDSIEIFKLMWKTFQRFGTFEEFKEILYKKRVSTGYWRLTIIKKEFKQEYFERYKASLLEIKEEEFFDDFYQTIDEKTRTIYDAVIQHETYQEVVLIVKNYDLENKIDKLNKKNRKLERSIKKYKKLNKKILNSRSWKITKPLRNLRNIFK
jgi:glycosyltransferase involved in cell wall biosynthesis